MLKRYALLVSVVSLVLVLLGGSPPAYAASTGSISGTVTLTGTGAPVSTYMRACLSTAVNDCTYVNSDEDGDYVFNSLAVGNYRVAISSGAWGIIYYDQTPGYSEATLVSVAADEVSSGIDFIVTPSATISGVITDSKGVPLSGIRACARIPTISSGVCADTNEAGEYSISGLIEGSYTVQFNAQYGTSNGYTSEFWDGVPTSDLATLISVTVGETVPGVNASLPDGPTISGTVTAPTVDSVEGIQICAYAAFSNCVTTDIDGDYVITVPADGDYTIYVVGTIDLAYQRYGQPNYSDPIQKVSTSASNPATGIDMELRPGGGISGTLTKESDNSPLEGLFVCFWAPGASQNGAPCGVSGDDGTYTSVGIPVGTYIAFIGIGSNVYGGFYFGNSPSTSERTLVTVSQGAVTPNVSGALPLTGAWPGTIMWAPTNTTVSAPQGTLTPNQSATTNSRAVVSYAVSNAGTTGCTVAQFTGVLTFTSAGTCQVSANTAISGAYAAASTTVDFAISRATQTVLWAPSNTSVLTTASPVTPSVLASSNGDGAITYSVTNAGLTGCSVNPTSGVLTFTGAGTCSVKATAVQTSTYAEGSTPVDFAISRATQTVSWAPSNTSVAATASPVTPSVLASSNGDGAITYSVTNAGLTGCSVNPTSGVLSFTGAGTCQVQASAAQTASYAAASTTVDFTISRATQTVSWSPSNTGVTGTSGTVTPNALASTNGNGTLTYSVVNSGATGCTINSTTALITYSGAGTCQVQASAAQTAMYEAGSKSVTFVFTSPPPAPSPDGGGSSGGGGGSAEATAPTTAPTPSTSQTPETNPTSTQDSAPPFVINNPSSVTASEVSAISPQRIATVAPEVFKSLAPAAFRGITPDQAERLTTAQVNNIRPDGAAQLRPATVAALAPANITAMRPASIARLSPNAVKAMSEEQIQAIRPEAVAKMTSRQLTAMSPSQISSMTAPQLKELNADQIQALTKAQVSALSKRQKKLLGL